MARSKRPGWHPTPPTLCLLLTRISAAARAPALTLPRPAQVLKDIETGQSRRMGYVTFEDGRSLTEAIEEMHETVLSRAAAVRLAACPLLCLSGDLLPPAHQSEVLPAPGIS